MRRLVFALALLLVASHSFAAESRCPLDVATCLNQFNRMRERPWLGVEFEMDSTGRAVVQRAVPGSPAARSGVRPGDVILGIDGQVPREWFIAKAGWKEGDKTAMTVQRKGRETRIDIPCEAISEENLARRIGVHMLEGPLAWAGKPDEHEH